MLLPLIKISELSVVHFARNAIIFYCLLEQYVTVIRVVITSFLGNSHSVVVVPLPNYCCNIDLYIVADLLASLLFPLGVRMHYFSLNRGGRSKVKQAKNNRARSCFSCTNDDGDVP